MTPPALTAEQRSAALAKAGEVRRARSELLASVRDGRQTIPSVLDRAEDDEVIRRTRVAQLIKAVPGVGSVRAAAVLREAGIDEGRRVGGLGDRQRRALAAIFSG